jgi:GNAT superfamily N-acetyltransferase
MIGSNRFCRFGKWSDRQAISRRSTSSSDRWIARPAGPADREAWEELFRGYCDFYERASTAERRDRVWGWTQAGTIRCLLAVPADSPNGGAVGLAHVRPCPSPLRGAMAGYLDDLFVTPEARGTGAFEALIDGIRTSAAAEGWEVVRWITAADNARAQGAYKRVSTRTEWVTYQLDV